VDGDSGKSTAVTDRCRKRDGDRLPERKWELVPETR